ncbi:MAG: hypothetical protein WDZ41_05475 [Candidatus Babeliales bacterium]
MQIRILFLINIMFLIFSSSIISMEKHKNYIQKQTDQLNKNLKNSNTILDKLELHRTEFDAYDPEFINSLRTFRKNLPKKIPHNLSNQEIMQIRDNITKIMNLIAGYQLHKVTQAGHAKN